MRGLFEFLCNRGTSEKNGEVHEQEIGHLVFGRSPYYDTSQDNIVRVQVSLLRKRLKSYFEAEGADEAFMIEIPAGSYLPVVCARDVPSQYEPPAVVDSPQTFRRPGRNRAVHILGAAAAVLSMLCLWLALLVWRGEERKSRSAEDMLWRQLSVPGQQTDVVLADSNVALLQDLAGRSLTLADYIGGAYMRWANEFPEGSEMRRILSATAGRPHTSLADVSMVKRALLYSGDPQRVAIYLARNFSARNLSTDNVLLLGSKRSNPWMEVFEDKLAYRFRTSSSSGRETVSVVEAGRQETAHPVSPGSGGLDSGYCQVAFLSNPGKTGHVLIVAGTNALATEAGGSLTGPEGEARLRDALSLGRSAPFPCFEVLLKTTHVAGSPSGFEIVYHRVIR
jgi:hypothetical protein